MPSIPVAGADRLKLTEHIAMIDLMELADALLLPRGRSCAGGRAEKPAVRPDEDDLFDTRLGSQGIAARELARQRREFRHATSALESLRSRAQARRRSRSTPVFGATAGARILRRLGHEANDALDEFLDLALDYERRETPSLQGFVQLAARGATAK